MANVHGKDTVVLLGDTDVSPYLNAASVSASVETADTTAYADEDRTYIAGLLTAAASLGGHFDGTSGASDEELQASLKTATLLSVGYGGSTTGNVWKGLQILSSDYSISAPVGDVVAVSYAASANEGGLSNGFSFHTLDAETSAGEETRLDQAAATAGGCVAFLHVTAFSGTDITIVLEDSANDASWANLLSFTQVTGKTSERIAVAAAASTPDRYVKCSWTGTFSSVTFFVGMARL